MIFEVSGVFFYTISSVLKWVIYRFHTVKNAKLKIGGVSETDPRQNWRFLAMVLLLPLFFPIFVFLRGLSEDLGLVCRSVRRTESSFQTRLNNFE